MNEAMARITLPSHSFFALTKGMTRYLPRLPIFVPIPLFHNPPPFFFFSVYRVVATALHNDDICVVVVLVDRVIAVERTRRRRGWSGQRRGRCPSSDSGDGR